MLLLLVLALAATTLTTPSVPPALPLVTALTEGDVEYLLEAPARRVRAMAPHLGRSVAEGLRRSPTFAGLMVALEQSDVIVQVVEHRHLPQATPAHTVLVNGTGAFRFLRIHVGIHRRGDDLVALLGHELFHALEIARATEVRDESALAAHYERIGFRGPRPHQFDTHDARTVEARVRRELRTPVGMLAAPPDAPRW
jgi:hypothetical protein